MAAQLVAMAAMSGFQMISGIQQAQMIRETASLTKEINDVNALHAEEDAQNALAFGFSQEALYQNVVDKVESRTRVEFATRNVDANFGTAAEMQADNQTQAVINKAKIRNQAYASAMGYKLQALNIRTQGSLAYTKSMAEATMTQNAAIMRAGGTFLSGYGKSATGGDSGGAGSGSTVDVPNISNAGDNFGANWANYW